MEINYDALVNMMIMAKVNEKSPTSAKLFNVFLKRGISMSDAMAILLEMLTLIEEMAKEEEAKDD